MKKQFNLGRALSKDEQMKVTGGNLPPEEGGGGCLSAACSLTTSSGVYYGNCNYGLGPCLCNTNYGIYEPASGVSACRY